MKSCPVCEGLTQLSKDCPCCGASMEDCGNIEDYWDPYGPFEEEKMVTDTPDSDPNYCVHLLQCPNCDENSAYTIEKIEI